ncbi:MAG: polysaccharide deacetylase family protein [Oscillospiraceae bacterium]|nr:polysaccharide deacetylase family protein [Oscillospiraceae bacterium]
MSVDNDSNDVSKPDRKKRPFSENDDTVKPVRKKRPSTESNVKKHSSQTVKKKEEAEPVQPKKTKLKLKKNAKILLAALGAVAVFCCVLIVNSSHKNVEEINAKHMASAEAYSEMESLAMETTEETVTETETETETETLPPATLNQSFENKEYPLFIDPNYSVDPTKPMIALTFDDGPAEGSTDDILDVLEQYHAHATFFVVGDNITPSTERLIKREYELGCEIGNHTKEHLSLRRELDLDGGLEALKAVDEKVNNCIGRETAHIRPPYGEYTEAILEACGRNFIYWSLDSNDWQWMDAEKDYDVVMENVSDGDIILMHDIHQPSADAVKRLVPDLIAQGYQFVTVSELMYYRNFTLDKGVVLYNLHPDAPFYDSLYEEEVTNYNPNGAAAQQYEPEEENNGDSDNADVNNEENADVISDADPELPAEQNVVPAYDNTAAEGGFVPDENVYPDVTVQENPQN